MTSNVSVFVSTGALLLFFLMALLFFGISADDAYIVARYAQNFNAGNGIVFNIGERINALTSPFHFIVFVLLRKISPFVVEIYKVIVAVVVALTLLWAGKVSFSDSIHRVIFFALTMLSPFLVFWTVGGLETPILLVLITIITVLLYQLKSGQTKVATKILILAGAAFLTRYDSALFLAPVVVYILYGYRHSAGVWVAATLTAAGISAWLIFSFYYFGDILPTSFYTKSPLTQSATSLIKGAFYLLNLLILTLLLLFPLLYFSGKEKLRFKSEATWILYLGLGAFLLYGVLAGTKHMMYGYRLFVPFVPVMVLTMMKAFAGKISTSPPAIHKISLPAIIIYQFMLAGYIYYESQNPNLTLLWRKQNLVNEIYEFSTVGARTSRLAEQVYRQNAEEIRQHWQTREVNARPPRVFILPGGVMPYSYPEAYVYETLVSYRHYCSYVLFESADYLQLIYPAIHEHLPAQIFGHRAKNWERFSSHKILAKGYAAPLELQVDLYYQWNPGANRLPSKINQPCI